MKIVVPLVDGLLSDHFGHCEEFPLSKRVEREAGSIAIDASSHRHLNQAFFPAGCGLCLEMAPRNFSTTDDEAHSYVSKRPENAFEEAQCQEAMEWCPVDAIGNEGLELEPAPYLGEIPRLAAVN